MRFSSEALLQAISNDVEALSGDMADGGCEIGSQMDVSIRTHMMYEMGHNGEGFAVGYEAMKCVSEFGQFWVALAAVAWATTAWAATAWATAAWVSACAV